MLTSRGAFDGCLHAHGSAVGVHARRRYICAPYGYVYAVGFSKVTLRYNPAPGYHRDDWGLFSRETSSRLIPGSMADDRSTEKALYPLAHRPVSFPLRRTMGLLIAPSNISVKCRDVVSDTLNSVR